MMRVCLFVPYTLSAPGADTGGESLDEQLEAFLKAEKLPAYLEFKQANQGDIFQSGISKQVRHGQ